MRIANGVTLECTEEMIRNIIEAAQFRAFRIFEDEMREKLEECTFPIENAQIEIHLSSSFH